MPSSNNYDILSTRLATIIQWLYEGRTLTKSGLAEEFNVSEKTIQRDLNKRISPTMPITYQKGIGWKIDQHLQQQNIPQQYAPVLEQRERTMKQVEIDIMHARDILYEADAILITAGAGMGVDSGLPDFRGTEGFWQAYPPMERLGLEFVDVANPKWFIESPKMAWGFYGHRLHLYRNTVPHKGFELLKKLVFHKGDNYFIFTSNVDGQFQKAGFDTEKIVERHGSIHHNQCIDSCTNDIWDNSNSKIEVDLETFKAISELPHCKHCSRLARPNILMFGDWGFLSNRQREQQDRLHTWLRRSVSEKLKIAIIEIGAGKEVPTVRHFSEEIVKQYGAQFIRINPRDHDGPDDIVSIPLGGQEAVEKILA
jgi:NAD-dependent SIR2 family protein deacetylase